MLLDTIIQTALRLLRDHSVEGVRARRRVAAATAMACFLLVLLAIVGFADVVLVLCALLALVTAVIAISFVVHRHAAQLRRRGRQIRRGARTACAEVRTRAAFYRAQTWRDAAKVSSRVVGIARSRARLLRHHGFAAVACAQRFGETLRGHYGARAAYGDRRSEATALNALGSELRRKGEFERAAEQHRMALALVRAVGDQRAEALTLNNLALAIDRGGGSRGAIEMFEQAAAMLSDLGDEEHEGQVMANLALAFRRHGSEQRCVGALEAALAKLNPQTNAYRKVDQLRRAS